MAADRARLRVIANAERDGGDVSVKRYIGMERRPEDVDVRALRDGDVDIGATTKEAHVYCERNAHFDAGIEIVMERIPLNENVAVYCEPCANAANACGSLQSSSAHESGTGDGEVGFTFDLNKPSTCQLNPRRGTSGNSVGLLNAG